MTKEYDDAVKVEAIGLEDLAKKSLEDPCLTDNIHLAEHQFRQEWQTLQLYPGFCNDVVRQMQKDESDIEIGSSPLVGNGPLPHIRILKLSDESGNNLGRAVNFRAGYGDPKAWRDHLIEKDITLRDLPDAPIQMLPDSFWDFFGDGKKIPPVFNPNLNRQPSADAFRLPRPTWHRVPYYEGNDNYTTPGGGPPNHIPWRASTLEP